MESSEHGYGMSPSDIKRIEAKVDQCLDSISKLILIDERQIVQAQRTTELATEMRRLAQEVSTNKEATDKAIADTNRKLDKWVNFGLGAWSLATTAFAIWQALRKG